MKRSALTITAFILMILLVLLAGFWQLFDRGTTMAGGRGFPGADGRFQGTLPEGMTAPDGTTGQGPQGNSNLPPGFQEGNPPGRDQNFTPNSNMVQRMKLNQLMRWGLAGLVILLGGISAIGIWMNKGWGKVLTIITSAIVLASTIPSMLMMPGGLNQLLAIVKLLLAVGVVVIVLLAGRKKFTTEELT